MPPSPEVMPHGTIGEVVANLLALRFAPHSGAQAASKPLTAFRLQSERARRDLLAKATRVARAPVAVVSPKGAAAAATAQTTRPPTYPLNAAPAFFPTSAAAVASAIPRNAIAQTPSALATPGPSPSRSASVKIALVIG